MTWEELKEQSDSVTAEWKLKNADITQYYQNKINDGSMSATEASKLLQAYSYERAARIMMEEWNENVNNADTTGEIPENYSFVGGDYGASLYKTSTTGDTVFIVGFNGTSDYKGRCADSVHFSLRIQSYSVNPTNSGAYWESFFIQPDGSIEPLPYELENQTYNITPTAYFPGTGYFGKELSITSSYTGTLRLSQAYIDDSNFFVNSKVYGGRSVRGYFKGQLGGVPPTLAAGTSLETLSTSMNLFGGNFGLIEVDPTDVDYASPWDWYNDVALPEIEDLLEEAGVDPSDFDDFETYPNGYNPVEPPEDPTEEEAIPDETGSPPETNFDFTISSPTSFITLYVLSAAQLSSFGNEMWGGLAGSNVVDIAKNFWGILSDTGTCDLSSALQLITSCMVFPFSIASTGINMLTGVTGIKIGTGHTTFISTENLFKLNSIVGCLDCGTCAVNPTVDYGKDFRNYYNCTVTAYLPFCGSVELNPTEVMFKTLSCKYLIDFTSGECTGVLINDFGNIVGSRQGQIGFPITLTASNARRIAGNIIDQGLTLGQSIIGSAIAGARNMSTMNSAIEKAQSTQETIAAKESGIVGAVEIGASMGVGVGKFANNLANGTGLGAPTVSGGGGAASALLVKQPFVQIRRSKYEIPGNFPTSVGYRSTKSGTLSEFAPYVECINVDVSGIEGAEESEKSLIKQLLESGVYI